MVSGHHSFLHSITTLEKLLPGPLACHIFFHSITTSGETSSRYLFQHGKLCENKFRNKLPSLIPLCEHRFLPPEETLKSWKRQ